MYTITITEKEDSRSEFSIDDKLFKLKFEVPNEHIELSFTLFKDFVHNIQVRMYQ